MAQGDIMTRTHPETLSSRDYRSYDPWDVALETLAEPETKEPPRILRWFRNTLVTDEDEDDYANEASKAEIKNVDRTM